LSYDLLRFILLPSICPLPSTSAGVLVTTLSCSLLLLSLGIQEFRFLVAEVLYVVVEFVCLFCFYLVSMTPGLLEWAFQWSKGMYSCFWSLKSCNLPFDALWV